MSYLVRIHSRLWARCGLYVRGWLGVYLGMRNYEAAAGTHSDILSKLQAPTYQLIYLSIHLLLPKEPSQPDTHHYPLPHHKTHPPKVKYLGSIDTYLINVELNTPKHTYLAEKRNRVDEFSIGKDRWGFDCTFFI